MDDALNAARAASVRSVAGRLPAIPSLRKKEDEERRGGAPPLAFLSGKRALTLGGDARLALARPGAAGFLGSLLGADVSPGAAALAAMGFVTLLLLAGPVFLDHDRAGGGWPLAARGGGARGEAYAFGVADALQPEVVRPVPRELIAPEKAEETAPAVDGLPARDAAKPETPAPALPPAVQPPVPPSPGLPAAPPRLAAASFGAGAHFVPADELRDSLAPFNGVRTLSDVAPAFKNLSTPSLTPPARDMRAAVPRSALQQAARAARAMGQLKFADRQSFGALGATGSDQARQYAADAFDQTRSLGGTDGTGMEVGGTVGPVGTGAPDVTQPPIGPAQNKTPYQSQANDAKQGIDQAMLLTALGLGLLAAGGAALLAGKALMSSPVPATHAMGLKVMLLGVALLAGGAAAIAAGLMMQKKAKSDGNSVAQQSGQKAQGEVINQCADQATKPASCDPAPIQQPGSTVHQDVSAESSAGYDLQGGGKPITDAPS